MKRSGHQYLRTYVKASCTYSFMSWAFSIRIKKYAHLTNVSSVSIIYNCITQIIMIFDALFLLVQINVQKPLAFSFGVHVNNKLIKEFTKFQNVIGLLNSYHNAYKPLFFQLIMDDLPKDRIGLARAFFKNGWLFG